MGSMQELQDWLPFTIRQPRQRLERSSGFQNASNRISVVKQLSLSGLGTFMYKSVM